MSSYLCNHSFLIETVENVVAFAGLSQPSADRMRRLLPSFLLKQDSCLRAEPGVFDPQGSQPAKRFLLAPKVGTEVAAQLKGLVAIERLDLSGGDTASAKLARSILESLPKAGIDDLFRQITRWRAQDRKDRKSATDTREYVSPATFSQGRFTISRITTPRDLRSVGARLRVCLGQDGYAAGYAGQLRRRETDFWVLGIADEATPTCVLSVDVLKAAVTEAVTKGNGSLTPALARPIHAFCKAYGFEGECETLTDVGLFGEHARLGHRRLARGVWKGCPYLVTQAGEQLRVRLRQRGNVHYAYFDTVRGMYLDDQSGLHELCQADAVMVLLHAVSTADAPADFLRMAAGRISEYGKPKPLGRQAVDDEEVPLREVEDWED